MRTLSFCGVLCGLSLLLAGCGEDAAPPAKTSTSTAKTGDGKGAAAKSKEGSAIEIKPDPDIVFYEDPNLSADLPNASEGRVTDDPIEAAYYGIWIWKQGVEKAKSFDVDKVREALAGMEFDAPGGPKKVDEENQHMYKPVYIGEIQKNGQFKIIRAMKGLIKPQAYSKYLDVKPEITGGPKSGKEYPKPDVTDSTVKIGIMHSLTGTMAISEISLKDVDLMAIEEINKAGGVLGRKIEPVIEDPGSEAPTFTEKATKLITQDKVAMVEGCWTSLSRKSVLSAFESNNALLFYPVQYEGQEQSKNVFYTAAPPNQQLVPAAAYMLDQGVRKFYLLGTDYVFPQTANRVLKAYLKFRGIPDANIAEEYTPFHYQDYQTIVQKIKKFAQGGGEPACVLSTINGDSNVPFYKEFANQGLTASDCPIMAFSVAEDELRAMDVPPLAGHLACWNYFQSINTPKNQKFVQDFKEFCKRNNLK